MHYYSIQPSLDLKIMGHYPQVKEVKYHCNIWDDQLFIDRFNYDEIKVKPIVANPILHPNSKLTDLIHIWSVGFSFSILISGKLKAVLETAKDRGIQFFQCSVFQNGIEYEDYWLLHMFKIDNESIDFTKSEISVEERNIDRTKVKKAVSYIHSSNELEALVKKHIVNNELVNVDRIVLKNNLEDEFLFLLYPRNFVVSENVKKKIEYSHCTGVEFMPIELSLNEWLASGGERERVYGKA